MADSRTDNPIFWFTPALLACVLVLAALCLYLIQRQRGIQQSLLREQERATLDQVQLQFRQKIEREWQEALKVYLSSGGNLAALRQWDRGLGPDFFAFLLDESGFLIQPNYRLMPEPDSSVNRLAARFCALMAEPSSGDQIEKRTQLTYRRMIAAWERRDFSGALSLAVKVLCNSAGPPEQALAATTIILDSEEITEKTLTRQAAIVDLWLTAWYQEGLALSPDQLPWLLRLQEQCRRRNERESWLMRERRVLRLVRQTQWADRFLPRLNLLLRRHLFDPARSQSPLQVLNSDPSETPFLTLCQFQKEPSLRLAGLTVDLQAFCRRLETSLNSMDSSLQELTLEIQKEDVTSLLDAGQRGVIARQDALVEERVLDPWAPQFVVRVGPRDVGEFKRRAVQRSLLYSGLTALTILSCVLILFFGNRALQEQQRLSKLRTDFLTNVSHELRTPLTAIRLHAETIERQLSESEQAASSSATTILEEVDRLGVLINDVLEFTRLENEKKQFVWETVDLVGVIEDSLTLFSQHFSALGFQVERDLPPVLILQRGDRAALKQCAVNLVSNALKFSPSEKHLTIRLRACGNEAVWTVQDQGIGILPEDRPHIFEKFYRSSALDPAMSGTGLGLTLCSAFIAAHGGTIVWEQPECGIGSRFVVRLPGALPGSRANDGLQPPHDYS